MSAQLGRVIGALAALMTALLLQAALVAPVAGSVPVSLPAVLVAAIALVDGPAAGMSFGFTLGLVADLGSNHPAGVLALSWLGLGLVCGLAAGRGTVRRDVAVLGVMCAAATAFATLLLALVHADGATVMLAVRTAVPAGLGDAVLALGVVPTVRVFLRTDPMRARGALGGQLSVGPSRD